MRGKIIAVFACVVLVVGGLSYVLTRATVGGLTTAGEAPRALAAASAQLQLDGLVLERWLAAQATNPQYREPFNAGTPSARSGAATAVATSLRAAAGATPEVAANAPGLVVVVDAGGVVLGRDNSELMRGEDLGAAYPALKRALTKGVTGSDVWVNKQRAEQLFASYAPVRDAEGQVIGGLVVGTSLNDERLTNASDKTSGRILLAAVRAGEGIEIIGKSRDASNELVAAVAKSKEIPRALGAGAVDVEGLPREYSGSAHALEGYGDGRSLLLVSIAHQQTASVISNLVWPALGGMLVGFALVVFGGFLLGNYISRPISEIEDGLLAIMNGRTDLRFQIEHAELGGLVFRLNSLLNQLLGVQEDETDEQGRPSRAPTAEGFQDALAVDETMASGESSENAADAKALREEADDAYYGRIFEEYIAAKRTLGDPVDHITQDAFIGRIMASERETAQKHGKPVRYKVEVRGREVVLLAVPLA